MNECEQIPTYCSVHARFAFQFKIDLPHDKESSSSGIMANIHSLHEEEAMALSYHYVRRRNAVTSVSHLQIILRLFITQSNKYSNCTVEYCSRHPLLCHLPTILLLLPLPYKFVSFLELVTIAIGLLHYASLSHDPCLYDPTNCIEQHILSYLTSHLTINNLLGSGGRVSLYTVHHDWLRRHRIPNKRGIYP